MCFASTTALDFAFRDARNQVVQHLIDAVVVLELLADAHGLAERYVDLLFDLAIEVVTDLPLGHRHLLLAGVLRQRVDAHDDLLDRLVRALERLDHLVFRHLFRTGLHHDDAVARAGDDQIEPAAPPLLECRVDEVFAVDEANTHARRRLHDGNGGEAQGRRGAGDGQDVTIVLAIRGQDERDDLRFAPPA